MSRTDVGDEQKLQELMLYVAQKLATDADFGAIVLNKALFFSDFLHYAYTGQPITGVPYRKLQHGPVPRRLVQVRDELIHQGGAAIAPATRYGHSQKRLVALRQPNLDLFTAQEIAQVDTVIEGLRERPAAYASELSHQWSVGWGVVTDGKDIPYETVYVAPPALLSEEIVAEGRALAERYAALE